MKNTSDKVTLVNRAGTDSLPVKANTYPLLSAIATWFNHFSEPHMTGLSAGAGPNAFFQPSRSLFLSMLGTFDCGLKILDLGCGYGEDAIALSGETNHVWGIDIAQQRLAVAEAKVARANKSGQVSLRNMDVHNLDFSDKFFDLIVANSFLMWVDKARTLEECHRVLKPGGRVIFSCETMPKNPFLKLHRRRPSMRPREGIVSRITIEEIIQLSCSFSSARWQQFYLVSPLLYPFALNMPKSIAVHRLVKGIQFLDGLLLRHFHQLRKYAWVSVMELEK